MIARKITGALAYAKTKRARARSASMSSGLSRALVKLSVSANVIT